MKWIETSITTTSDGIEHVEGILEDSGVSGWEVVDYKEMRTFLADNPAKWDYIDERVFANATEIVTIRFYADNSKNSAPVAEAVESGIRNLASSHPGVDFGPLSISTKQIADDNWVDNWKKYFKPFEIGERIVIAPAWEEHEREDKIVVMLDPGHMFGTGQHESTRMCIEALERHIKPGDTMLDLGCGSGILSIAGLMLGAEKCVAADINPEAVETTYKNAERNGISKNRLSVRAGDILRDAHFAAQLMATEYECITANIIADAIISLSKPIAREGCLKPGGIFIASGIIKDRTDDVLLALKDAGFRIVDMISMREWACIVAGRQ